MTEPSRSRDAIFTIKKIDAALEGVSTESERLRAITKIVNDYRVEWGGV